MARRCNRVVSVVALIAVMSGAVSWFGCASADSDCQRVDGGAPDAGGDDCDDGEGAADAADDALQPGHIFEHLFP